MDGLDLRIATLDDAPSIAEIYRPYVRETAVTFEEEPPDADEVEARIGSTLETYPWFVAERGGRVEGYAYAGALRERAAYRWTAELSVYVDRERRGGGDGAALYRALLATLERQGFESAYGVVTLPNPESAAFHERFGFERVARLPAAGFKLGEWHDVAWYERPLGERAADPTQPSPFSECDRRPWLEDLLDAAVDSDVVPPSRRSGYDAGSGESTNR